MEVEQFRDGKVPVRLRAGSNPRSPRKKLKDLFPYLPIEGMEQAQAGATNRARAAVDFDGFVAEDGRAFADGVSETLEGYVESPCGTARGGPTSHVQNLINCKEGEVLGFQETEQALMTKLLESENRHKLQRLAREKDNGKGKEKGKEKEKEKEEGVAEKEEEKEQRNGLHKRSMSEPNKEWGKQVSKQGGERRVNSLVHTKLMKRSELRKSKEGEERLDGKEEGAKKKDKKKDTKGKEKELKNKPKRSSSVTTTDQRRGSCPS
ncbi:Histone deacetylase complex subunit SAP18 [Balamuthia mandrillaris]